MSDAGDTDSAARLARATLDFEDAAARIRSGAEAGGLTLSEVRLLDGVAKGETGARLLSRRMGLDEGHVSRTVKRLRGAGLLDVARRAGDARRRDLSLTAEGRRRLDEALRGAEAAAAAILGAGVTAPWPAAAEALPVDLTALRPGDAGWVIGEHGALYARDEGFDSSFEAHVGFIVARFLQRHDPARERGWIARRGAERLGCIFCTTAEEGGDTAQLRLFLVRPEARRTGLGWRLVAACRDFAAAAGYSELVLHTHREHEAACALYRRFGFTLTESYPVTAYGRALEEQVWAIPLDAPLAKPAPRR